MSWTRQLCGCYYLAPKAPHAHYGLRHYLPLVQSEFHATVLSNTLHTTLKQTFSNPTKENIETCKYTFPLYEGVSVVGFSCQIADRHLTGVVKEKAEAKAKFDEAVSRGESAGLLEQSDEASDVFSTNLGNVAAGQKVDVEITYVGELKNDAEIDGLRLTIPTAIAPRYGSGPEVASAGEVPASERGGIKITVDVNMPDDCPIRSVQSPSHPISVSLGALSYSNEEQDPSLSKACATLSLGETALEKDFVLMVQAKDTGIPKAILERHPTLEGHRALSVTLVPKFSLPEIRPEIVFVADRSGSMSGNIPMLQDAMRVFLKSLPPKGVKFNICSFGTSHSFLWRKSKSYDESNLNEAISHIETFQADYGGTETLKALKATIEQRSKDIPLEIILLTDGDIWQQEEAFEYINEQVKASKGQIRLFPLGIGNGVSHALIEGLARSGNGFAQSVQLEEKLDSRVVRMLKGALSPHITDYSLEVKYRNDDDFEVIDKVADSLKVMVVNDKPGDGASSSSHKQQAPISLFDTSANPDKEERVQKYLPDISIPKMLQAPHQIPSLFPFARTSVYVLMSPKTIQQNPVSVVFRASSEHGPLALEMPIQAPDQPGQTVHQLAARKAVQDLEESRGWVHDALDDNNQKIKERLPSRFDDIVKREAVRIGTTFQVANRWCSFVAVEDGEKEVAEIGMHQVSEEEGFVAQATTSGTRHAKRARRMKGLTMLQSVNGPGNALFAAQAQPYYMPSASRHSANTSSHFFATQPPPPHAYGSVGPQGGLFGASTSLGAASAGAGSEGADSEMAMSFGNMDTGDVLESFDFDAFLESGNTASFTAQQQQYGNFNGLERPQPQSQPSLTHSLMSEHHAPSTSHSLRQPPAPPSNNARVHQLVNLQQQQQQQQQPIYQSSSRAERHCLVTSDSAPQPPAPPSNNARVHQLINLQRFEGFWSASDAQQLAQAMGCTEAAFQQGPGGGGSLGLDVWATALVIAFLEEKMGSEKGVWEMVVEKAGLWLGRQVGDAPAVREKAGSVVRALVV